MATCRGASLPVVHSTSLLGSSIVCSSYSDERRPGDRVRVAAAGGPRHVQKAPAPLSILERIYDTLQVTTLYDTL